VPIGLAVARVVEREHAVAVTRTSRRARSCSSPAVDSRPRSRPYRRAGGDSVERWELPDTGHTAGLRTHPAEYERRGIDFLDRSV
jgi:hypothetical protein